LLSNTSPRMATTCVLTFTTSPYQKVRTYQSLALRLAWNA